MIKGIKGKTYFDLSEFVNINSFIDLHPFICKGIVLGSKDAAHGILKDPNSAMNLDVYNNKFKPLHKVYEEFLNLSNDNLIKSIGTGFNNDNDLSLYLKYALGGYDLYSFYVLVDFKNGWRDTDKLIENGICSKYFPEVMNWLNGLIENKIFSYIGRASFFVQEAGGISFEHRDDALDPECPEILSEFIHIRPHLRRPFYIRDRETSEKIYINAQIAYWNDQDYHGGDPVMEPTYAFRVDGVFTDEFKENLK
jgi:hypothetical protein